jgi:predicted phosphodiesterase
MPAAARGARVLAVSDEVDEALRRDASSLSGIDLILACGDLPFEYLTHLMEGVGAPLVFVPGNHDPDVSGYRERSGLVLRGGMPCEPPWPPGAVNADGKVVDVGGLRIAGLGGCARYTSGPNQYSERQQAHRARRLAVAARWRRHGGRGVDVLLTHAPPRGVGDAVDAPHRGFVALHDLVARLDPVMLLHGHVHPFGAAAPDLTIGRTVVRNVVGRHVFTVASKGAVPVPEARHRGS